MANYPSFNSFGLRVSPKSLAQVVSWDRQARDGNGMVSWKGDSQCVGSVQAHGMHDEAGHSRCELFIIFHDKVSE